MAKEAFCLRLQTINLKSGTGRKQTGERLDTQNGGANNGFCKGDGRERGKARDCKRKMPCGVWLRFYMKGVWHAT